MDTGATSSPKRTRLTVAVLLVFVVLVVSMRFWLKQEGELPGGDSVWQINVYHEVEALEKGAEIHVPPPWDTIHARLFSQSLSHPGLHQRRTKEDRKLRDIVLVAPRQGYFTVETSFSMHVSDVPFSEPKRAVPTEQDRSLYLASSVAVSVGTADMLQIVEDLTRSDLEPGQLIDELFNYVSNHIRIDNKASSDSEIAIQIGWATGLGSVRALVALSRTAHLPARIVTGVNLHAPASQQPFYWAEVYDGDQWIAMDPVHGYLRELPPNYIPLRKGDSELVKTKEATVSDSEWRIVYDSEHPGLFSVNARKLTDIFNLNRLSPQSRETLAVLLLLPLGALATEMLRQFTGVRTYGTFTPTLLALAITHVEWQMALIVFSLVTFIGVAIRAIMPNLELQRTPRLAIVFTLVAISMAIVVSGIKYFDPRMDSSVVLLPTVILTMLVDRIYTVYDENGVRVALVRLFWTIVSAIMSLAILLQVQWGSWLVSYPEAHAITLAVVIMIGLYKGPRLMDVAALSWLREPPRTSRNRKTDRKSGRRQSSQSGDTV